MIVLALAVARAANADPERVAVAMGLAGGGGWTPGGVRVDGSYLLALDARDGLDVGVGLTIGGDRAACAPVSTGGYTCSHGLVQGQSLAFRAGYRRFFGRSAGIEPFLRVGAAIAVIRFPDDVVTTMTESTAMPMPTTGLYGVAIAARAGVGVRVPYSPSLAFTFAVELEAGLGVFAGNADGKRILGGAMTAGLEVRL